MDGPAKELVDGLIDLLLDIELDHDCSAKFGEFRNHTLIPAHDTALKTREDF